MPDQTEMHQSSDELDDPNLTRLSDGAAGAGAPGVPALLAVPGFDVLSELGRGGMGIVYRARDRDLTREVAIKMLQTRYAGDHVATRRFVAESDITARLAHPSVPPVHRVGTLPDGRPYLVMKLIDGKTLDELLKARAAGFADLPRHLDIFEHVCQAVAFAHARGVIHRDLKPHNVMVGAFGEVQVMDWGLAKQVGSGRWAVSGEEIEGTEATESTGTDLVSREPQASADETQAGTVLGTPAYMAPEQARGEAVGPASDVFGLGALLCCVLTGEAPFGTTSSDGARMMSIRGELAPAFARLDALTGEADLVALCKRCLNADPALRPADAGAVATALAAVRAAAEERAERAEQDRTRAETRAAELRKRRQVWAALALAVVVLLGVVGGVLWWADHQSVERKREREVAAARDREGIAGTLDAAEVALKAGHLADADASLVLAQKRLAEHPDADPDGRYLSLVRDRDAARELERAFERAWTDTAKWTGGFNEEGAKLYPAAFEKYGLNVGRDPPAEIADKVRAARVADELTAGLNEWFVINPQQPGLRAVVDQLDRDPERTAIRAAVATGDRARLLELAEKLDGAKLAPRAAILLGMNYTVPPARAVELMTAAWRTNPDNFPLTLRICIRFEQLHGTRLTEAIGWCRVAVALRGRSVAARTVLGNALSVGKRTDEAIVEYRYAVELDPTAPAPASCWEPRWRWRSACPKRWRNCAPRSASNRVRCSRTSATPPRSPCPATTSGPSTRTGPS
jgi:serine/threonine protein kinase